MNISLRVWHFITGLRISDRTGSLDFFLFLSEHISPDCQFLFFLHVLEFILPFLPLICHCFWVLICMYVCYVLFNNTHTHTFNGPFSGTTQVGRYQKGKTNLDFTEARDNEWQWHQLGHMQVCTSLQTDNHASTSPLSFLQAGCPSCRPTNSVKALKAVLLFNKYSKYLICHFTSSCIGCKLQKLSYAVGQMWLQTARGLFCRRKTKGTGWCR